MSGGVYGNYEGMMSTQSPQGAHRSAHEHIMSVNHELHLYEQQFQKVLGHLQGLVNEVDTLHQHYDEVTNETQYLNSTAAQAEECVANARCIFERYTAVADPVVASDGFTYEREVITEYINNAAQENITPLSNQTKEPLTSLLIPNRTLKTLLSRLDEHLSADHTTPSPTSGASHNNNASGGGAAAAAHSNGSATGNAAGGTAGPRAGSKAVGSGKGPHHAGTYDSNPSALPPGATHGQLDGDGKLIELNAKGERVHPCIRVYGYCNYKDSCAYAKYPYEACLSNLKGKCRFKNQCHERHVEFKGPLNDNGEPMSEAHHAAAAPKESIVVPAPASARVAEKK